MEKKYKLTREFIIYEDIILYRIQALKSFGKVKKEQKGGFVESEKNLSHLGNCWVFDNARIYNEAIVLDDAEVYNDAQVLKNAKIYEQATIAENATITDNVMVGEQASIRKYRTISGYAHIRNKGHEELYSYITIGPIRDIGFITFEKVSKIINADRFSGTIKEFEKMIKEQTKFTEKSDYFDIANYFKTIK